ncbi:MAG TPA: Nramp family divalent metal transporter [Terriglobales bacterium]|jgi:manganese transport protein|nr:Nramp family divalent metal transporter [Terriglobales bacterium]
MSSSTSTPANNVWSLKFKALPAFRSGELWYYFGPAFVASVAYIDPGNFATNIEGGTRFGYSLLWVLLWSNAMAILIQYLSAKLGIATGLTLPQNCRANFSRGMTLFLWVAAELAALATDLAEFLGAALGFYLLVGPTMLAHGLEKSTVLMLAALATAVLVFLILALELYGFRKLEVGIMIFVFGIAACYAIEIFLAKPNWAQVGYHILVPEIGSESIYIAVGMLGATVMPHVVYLHSALVQGRARKALEGCPTSQRLQRLKHLQFEIIDVFAAMNGAWLINTAMIVMAAAVFFTHGQRVASIEEAHQTLAPLLGGVSAMAFALALLLSGLSSSTVGTMAGQVIIEGFLNIRFSVFLRRFITMIPALVVIAMKLDPLKILVLSQVGLSFALPFALVPLIMLTRRTKVMGELANGRTTNVLAYASVTVIISLNMLLLYQIFGGKF